MYIQRLITEDYLTLAYSYMSLYENKDNPIEARQTSIIISLKMLPCLLTMIKLNR